MGCVDVVPWLRGRFRVVVVVELTRSKLVLHPHNAQTCGHKAFHVVRKLFLLNVRESLRNPCIANYALLGCTKKRSTADLPVCSLFNFGKQLYAHSLLQNHLYQNTQCAGV